MPRPPDGILRAFIDDQGNLVKHPPPLPPSVVLIEQPHGRSVDERFAALRAVLADLHPGMKLPVLVVTPGEAIQKARHAAEARIVPPPSVVVQPKADTPESPPHRGAT